jgi:hypothetical protein
MVRRIVAISRRDLKVAQRALRYSNRFLAHMYGRYPSGRATSALPDCSATSLFRRESVMRLI